MPRSHYDNLQVSRSASERVIKAAYKSLAHEWHPDRNSDRIDEAERNIKIINEAYRVLIDPDLRFQHDNWLKRTEEKLRNEQPRSETHQERQQYRSGMNEDHQRYRGDTNHEHQRYRDDTYQEHQPHSPNTGASKTPLPEKLLPRKSLWWIGAIIGLLISLIPDEKTGFTPLSEIALSLQTGASFSIWGSTLIGVYLAGCIFSAIIVAIIRGHQKRRNRKTAGI